MTTKYQIEVVEECTYLVDVEAESEEEATKAVWDGEVDFAHNDSLVDSSVISVIAKGSEEEKDLICEKCGDNMSESEATRTIENLLICEACETKRTLIN